MGQTDSLYCQVDRLDGQTDHLDISDGQIDGLDR